jgi:hypothetical protein
MWDALAIPFASIPVDTLYLGNKASTSAKNLIFETGDGANNSKISVDDSNIMDFITGGTSRALMDSGGLTLKDQGDIRLREGSGGGTNYTGFQAPSTLAGDVLYTLPSADGSAHQFLQTDGAGTMAWAAPQDSSLDIKNLGLAVTVNANAATISLVQKSGANLSTAGPVKVNFRNETLGTGTYSTVSITSALSTVISSGSTGGFLSGQDNYLYIYIINNSGAAEVAWSRIIFDEGTLVSTTTEGSAGGADSNRVMYSTTGRSNVPHRVFARVKFSLTTAGTWDEAGDEVSLLPFEKGQFITEYHSNGGTAVTANVTDIPFTTKSVDTHGTWSGTVFTAAYSSLYTVIGKFLATAATTGTVDLYIDGSFRRVIGDTSAVSTDNKSFQSTIWLNAGQTLSVRSGASLTLDSSAAYSYINIFSNGPKG